MANNIKYQIFISSTFEDLRSEREAVTRAVLEMGHIPVGMEMFSAADEEQWQIIARHIEESDYYAVVLAHRLGSLTPEGISYTRKEYQYARDLGIPCLGFIIDSSAPWPADRIDKNTGTKKGLDEFKTLVKEKPVDFWVDASELHSKFSISLMKTIVARPREGWVRASEAAADKVLIKEVARLSAENSELRGQVATMKESSDHEREAEQRETVDTLFQAKRTPHYRYSKTSEWVDDVEVTLFGVFATLAPEMIAEAEVSALANLLAMDIRADQDRGWDIVAINQIKLYLADFMTLELVQPSTKRHAVSDLGEYWSLTSFGVEILKLVRKVQLRAPAVADVPIEEGLEDSVAESPNASDTASPATRAAGGGS